MLSCKFWNNSFSKPSFSLNKRQYVLSWRNNPLREVVSKLVIETSKQKHFYVIYLLWQQTISLSVRHECRSFLELTVNPQSRQMQQFSCPVNSRFKTCTQRVSNFLTARFRKSTDLMTFLLTLSPGKLSCCQRSLAEVRFLESSVSVRSFSFSLN